MEIVSNVKKSAVMVLCNEDREEPVEYRWKWGIEEIAVVDQYTYLGVVVVVVVVVFTLKTIPVSLSSTSFCLNLSVLIHHLTRPISVVTG